MNRSAASSVLNGRSATPEASPHDDHHRTSRVGTHHRLGPAVSGRPVRRVLRAGPGVQSLNLAHHPGGLRTERQPAYDGSKGSPGPAYFNRNRAFSTRMFRAQPDLYRRRRARSESPPPPRGRRGRLPGRERIPVHPAAGEDQLMLFSIATAGLLFLLLFARGGPRWRH